MLSWAAPFNICCFLDNHGYGLSAYPSERPLAHSFECLLAAGAKHSIRAAAGDALGQLEHFISLHNDWMFGHFGYGLAKETMPDSAAPSRENSPDSPPIPSASAPLSSDPIGFPDLFFFIPEILIELGPDTIRIGLSGKDHKKVLNQILDTHIPGLAAASPQGILAAPSVDTTAADPGPIPPLPDLVPRFSRKEYLATVNRLRAHILRGDCYEINFCQEFYARPAAIDPLATWFSLSRHSPNPFGAYYRVEESHLLCASPERYLRRTGNTLLSQPIKGTWARSPEDPAADQAGRDRLYSSSKDRSENVMVVDLVRNDLSRICLPGSVRVDELYGIYSFPHVHQMISSVKGELPPSAGLTDCIRATFPMGSMTGAPKKRVVELIEQYERAGRGLFSGAVGYVAPGGDFDFNVVIRSILYNAKDQYLSYQVGSGITFYSDPDSEYEECLVKAEGMRKALRLE